MLTTRLEDHYQAQVREVARDCKRQCDALRPDDESKRRLFEMAPRHMENPVVSSLADQGADYTLRLLSVIYGMEHDRITEHNIKLQNTVVELGRQLIEERRERSALEARLASQEAAHRAAMVEDLRLRQTLLDRAHVAACAALPPISSTDKNPHLQTARELFLHHAEVMRTILLHKPF